MKLSCCIVIDLLPNYLEGLTSIDSNKEIEEHLKTCEQCKKKYEDLSTSLIMNESQKQKNVEEVDYLIKCKNKNKKKNVIFFIAGILCTNFLIAGLFLAYSQQYNLNGVSRYPSFTIDNAIGPEYICKSDFYEVYTYHLNEVYFTKFDSRNIQLKEALTQNRISIDDMIKKGKAKKSNQMSVYEFENYQIILNGPICLIAPLNIDLDQVFATLLN